MPIQADSLSGGLLQAMPDIPSSVFSRGEEMKSTWTCDEEGIVCTVCGKDIYHCECGETEIVVEELATSRRHEVVKLKETGLAYAEIGRRLGITRERVRQILKGIPAPQKPDLHSRVMLTTSDVAQLIGLHPNTVRRWNRRGILKSYRVGARGDRRFRREEVDAFLNERETE